LPTKEDETLLGEFIDKTCTVAMRPVLQNVGLRLYAGARRKQTLPLSYLAARSLIDNVRPGYHALITTGAGEPQSIPNGETDGPIGAASLARAIAMLGGIPVLVSEEVYLAPIKEPGKIAGLQFDNGSKMKAQTEKFPFGSEEGKRFAKYLIETYNPSIVISTERLGPNILGVNHNMGGKDWSQYQARVENLFDIAKERNVKTLGVGDGGNEIGCGLILEDAKKSSKYGAKCQCPCGGGVACSVPADVLMIGASSNWGCFGIEAELAAMTNRPELLHSAELDSQMLAACIAAGGRDGPSGKQIMVVDGTEEEVHEAMLRLLAELVKSYVNSDHNKL